MSSRDQPRPAQIHTEQNKHSETCQDQNAAKAIDNSPKLRRTMQTQRDQHRPAENHSETSRDQPETTQKHTNAAKTAKTVDNSPQLRKTITYKRSETSTGQQNYTNVNVHFRAGLAQGTVFLRKSDHSITPLASKFVQHFLKLDPEQMHPHSPTHTTPQEGGGPA